ncbi:FUSC family protein, partial [Streptomyces cavourensis]|nr:FUSC family protein [Streptomyces cavourensis]
ERPAQRVADAGPPQPPVQPPPTGTETPPPVLPGEGGSQVAPQTLPGVHKLRLAEAAYAQYRTETPAEDTRTDWHAMLIAANHMLLGAHYLPRFGLRSPVDATDASAAWARTTARESVAEVDRIAALLTGGAPEPVRRRTAADDRPPAPLSVDLEVWLESLGQQLTRIDASLTAPQPPQPVTPSGRRTAPPG